METYRYVSLASSSLGNGWGMFLPSLCSYADGQKHLTPGNWETMYPWLRYGSENVLIADIP
jgi:hypothetical protein